MALYHTCSFGKICCINWRFTSKNWYKSLTTELFSCKDETFLYQILTHVSSSIALHQDGAEFFIKQNILKEPGHHKQDETVVSNFKIYVMIQRWCVWKLSFYLNFFKWIWCIGLIKKWSIDICLMILQSVYHTCNSIVNINWNRLPRLLTKNLNFPSYFLSVTLWTLLWCISHHSMADLLNASTYDMQTKLTFR